MTPRQYEKNAARCNKFGHDWAFQDCETFMLKLCLRCGETIYFFPEETDQEVDE